MGYTIEDLVYFISQHDDNEDMYRKALKQILKEMPFEQKAALLYYVLATINE